ncbi:uncharacterized protein METZ01_LOCUS274587, partial [marine metagenome]
MVRNRLGIKFSLWSWLQFPVVVSLLPTNQSREVPRTQ